MLLRWAVAWRLSSDLNSMPAGPTEFEMESDKEYIHERSVSRCCAKDQIQNIKFKIKLVKLD